MAYCDLENHLRNCIGDCSGEWVRDKNGYEECLCTALGLQLSKGRYQDATWNECSIELKKGTQVWLDLVRLAELIEKPELGGPRSITLFCKPTKNKQAISEILGVTTEALIEHFKLKPEHIRMLLELNAHVPRQLNAQASLTVSDIRRIALFKVEPRARLGAEPSLIFRSPLPRSEVDDSRNSYLSEKTGQQWTRRKPLSFTFLGTKRHVRHVKEVLVELAIVLYEKNPQDFWNKVSQLRSSRGKEYYAHKCESFDAPKSIGESGIWMETNFANPITRRRCLELLAAFGHSADDLQVEFPTRNE